MAAHDAWHLLCHRCGGSLGDDPDDQADGGADGLPICGPCARIREDDVDVSMLDARDGELDVAIDW